MALDLFHFILFSTQHIFKMITQKTTYFKHNRLQIIKLLTIKNLLFALTYGAPG